METMKLYCFYTGSTKLDKSFLTGARGLGQSITVPVPMFLITHPEGNVIFDTGMNVNVIDKPEEIWGFVSYVIVPIMKEEDKPINQLKKLGYEADDIKYVVNSHLHLDHAGSNQFFPTAEFLVQKDELRVAYWPEIYQRGSYIREDFDHPLNYNALEGDYDIFGDGKVVVMRATGHSQGHQCLIVTLENTGTVVLTGDSSYTHENLDQFVLPGIVWNPDEAMKTINKLRYLRDKKGAMILMGHDPELWDTLKHAPEYYD